MGERCSRVRFPQTIYAVALLYFNPARTHYALGSRTFDVSGEAPLTSAEAIGRARAAVEAEWGDSPPEANQFDSGAVSCCVQKTA